MRATSKRWVVAGLVLILLGLIPMAAGEESGPSSGDWSALVGTWQGTIQAGSVELLTVFHLRIGEDGALTGGVDSPEQGAYGLPISSVERNEDGSVTIKLAVVQATYVASLSEDGKTLSGEWSQRGASLPLAMTRGAPEIAAIEGVERFIGTWEGKLEVNGMSLRIVYKLQAAGEGQLTGTMESPDQGAKDIPIDRVKSPAAGTLKLFAAGSEYEGALDETASRIEGEFRQGGLKLPLVLERVKSVSKLNRPQTPQPPFPYLVREISYPGSAKEVTLAGTLTLPETGGPFPAVLLITGSGAQDRDETIHEHKPFLLLADTLTRRGIAVLRVDDRGIGGSVGPAGTSADFAGDVRAGVKYLAGLAEIDSRQIGLIGHSEGGIIAPMVAAESDQIAFLVLIAAPGVAGERLLPSQGRALGRASGLSEEQIEANRKTQEKLFAVMKNQDLDSEQAVAQMRAILRADPNIPKGPERDQFVETQLAIVSSDWLKFFVSFDPATVLEKVTCPVLAINGTLDLQVPAEENLQAIGKALEAAGNKDVTLAPMPGLNHLLQKATTGLVTEYATIEETINPAALQRMADWISEHTKAP